MKIAQILYSGLGGHGSVVFSMLSASRDHSLKFVLGFLGIEPILSDYQQHCEIAKIPYTYFPAISGKPWLSWPAIARWLESEQPDTILLHSSAALLPCWWFAKWHHKKLIVVEHQANKLKTKAEWTFSYLSMLLATKIVILTPEYKQELQKGLKWGFRPHKISIIENGIDTKHFQLGKQVPLDNRFQVVRLGMAARFMPTKRQDILVKTIERLVALHPSIQWELTLAGNGITWQSIADLVKDKKLEKYVTLNGNLSNSELVLWLQSLDIYIHATEGETLSISLLQAMACQLPIIASNVDGVYNLLSNEHNTGFLVDNQDITGFVEQILYVVSNPTIALERAAEARRVVLEKYSSELMLERYLKIMN